MSIDAQRRELQALASSKALTVAAEFTDEVEAANDVSRPGFCALLASLKDPERPWSTLIVMDTSRLARNVYLAESFKYECKRRGVSVIYSKLPSVNPMIDLIVTQVVQAFDQLHSMMSKEKGLAGMAENVRQGFRAGGRAPFGYRLERIETGAIREGEPVHKSRLVLSEDAPAIARYLKDRAAGLPAIHAAKPASLMKLAKSTLVGIEWNALTYAGHTVWNVHHNRTADGYEHGTKRRPRAEWVIQRDTHEALITDAEAEQILARLTRKKTMRARSDDYLLSGILRTSAGRPWHGNVGFYRTGAKSISAPTLERIVVARIAEDLTSEHFIKALAGAARKAVQPDRMSAELAGLQKRLDTLAQKIGRLTALLEETDTPRPLLARIDELEKERAEAQAQAGGLNADLSAFKALHAISEADVRIMLQQLAGDLEGLDRSALKALLRGLIEKITLDPAELKACIAYAIPLQTGVSVASPRGIEPIPTLRARRFLVLPRKFRRVA